MRNMAFDPREAERLLARCHRRCCVCHRFCGSKMELDHMQPKAEGGPDDIENAIPLCFECHAEVHASNDKHPRGRKFQPSELRLHKEQWLAFCDRNPAALATFPVDVGVGPLQSLIDEIDFNLAVASRRDAHVIGCPFSDEQFRRAMNAGAISVLQDFVKEVINSLYADLGRANHFLATSQHYPPGSDAYNTALNEAQKVIIDLGGKLGVAREQLLQALGGPG
jgi:hypothetical protein